jgi:hypothetical protein
MPNNANLGFEHRFSFMQAGGTFNGSSPRFDVVSSSVRKRREILDGMGVLGTRSGLESRSRQGVYHVEGQLSLDISPLMFDWFLPYILGTAESTDTYAVADSLPGFDMLHDPFGTGSSATKFEELYVNRFTLRGAAGILRATLDLVGKTATGGLAFAGAALGTTATTAAPYVFHDTASGITINATTQEVNEFELVIDNALDVKFRNAATAQSIRATDRLVTLSAAVPLTTTSLSTHFGDKAAADATIVITNGTVATTFTLNNFKVADDGPEMGDKGEVLLRLNGRARGDGTDAFDVQTTVVGGSL